MESNAADNLRSGHYKTKSGRPVRLTEKAYKEACRKIERAFWRALFNLERCGRDLDEQVDLCHDPTTFKNYLVAWMQSYSLVKEGEGELRRFLPPERLEKLLPDISVTHERCLKTKDKAFRHLESLTLDMHKELNSDTQEIISSPRKSRSSANGSRKSKLSTSPRKAGRRRSSGSSSSRKALTQQLSTLKESLQSLKTDVVNLTTRIKQGENTSTQDTISHTVVTKPCEDGKVNDRAEDPPAGAYGPLESEITPDKPPITIRTTMSDMPPIRRSCFNLPSDGNFKPVIENYEYQDESTPKTARRVRTLARDPPRELSMDAKKFLDAVYRSPPKKPYDFSPRRHTSRTSPVRASFEYRKPTDIEPRLFGALPNEQRDLHEHSDFLGNESRVEDLIAECPQLSEEEIREDMMVWQQLQEKYATLKISGNEFKAAASQKKSHAGARPKQPSNLFKTFPLHSDGRGLSATNQDTAQNSENVTTSSETNLLLANAVEHLAKATECMYTRDQSKDSDKEKPKLPNLSPAVFQGDTLSFHVWMNSFKTLVESRVTDPLRRLCYLEKFVDGPAKAAIKELLDLTDDTTAYERAIVKLRERYGSPMIVAEAFRKRIKSWPHIKPDDAQGLTQYADFLSHCDTAMKSIGFLRILAEPEENRKLAEKLPEKILDNWNRKVVRAMYPDSDSDSEPSYPSFKTFCAFLKKEARVASGPCAPKSSSKEKKKVALLTGASTDTDKKDKGKASKPMDNGSRSNKNKDSSKDKDKDKPVKKSPLCLLCKDKHWINKCPNFLDLSPLDRRNYCAKHSICFGCLQTGHDYVSCKFQCNYLLMTIPDGLDKRTYSGTTESTISKDTVTHSVHSLSPDIMHHYTTVVPVKLSHKNKPDQHIVVYALLDSQSDGCYVSEDALKRLNVGGSPCNLNILTMGDRVSEKSLMVMGLTAQGIDRGKIVGLPECYSRRVIPANRNSFARVDVVKDWPHLSEVIPRLCPYDESIPVGLLIGYNCDDAAMHGEIVKVDSSIPWAVNTVFGWTVCGPARSDCPFTGDFESTCFLSSVVVDSFASLRDAFDLDFQGPDSEKKQSYEDVLFMRCMEEGFRFDNDGHVVLPLPVREGARIPPGSRNMAYRRFKNYERTKLKKDEKILNACISFFGGMLADGHAEEAPPLTPEEILEGLVWYLPHQIVYHPRKPDKPRVVYDGSAEVDGVSLNDILMQGPDLANSLLGVLLRFREGKIAFQCDLMKMFHQVRVSEKWRNLLRFFWYKNNDPSQPIIEYRVTVHLFGATSSPSVATFALRKIADTYESKFGLDIASFIRKYFYVDDGLRSVDAVEKALHILTGSSEMCALGGFKLHQIASNNLEVIQSIPKDMLCKELQSWSPDSPLPVLTALGVQWNLQLDAIVFVIKSITYEMTRRGLLSAVGTIYDPIGLISPVVMKGRLILQELCHENLTWDQTIGEDVQERWNEWYIGLKILEGLCIPRCYRKNVLDVSASELHCFGDASGSGYGGCIYLVLEDEKENRDVSLVMGKSRVKPIKKTTTPRLELQAAVLITKMCEFVKEELPKFPNMTIYYWSDSMIILAYITNTGTKYRIYVANRVQTIRDKSESEQWGHVISEDNPADIASRGCNAEDIMGCSLWFEGPAWLKEKICKTPITYTVPADDPEVLHEKVTLDTVVRCQESGFSILEALNKLPSWNKMIFAVQLWRNAMKIWHSRARMNRGKIKRDLPRYTPVEERNIAKNKIIQLLQAEAFPKEYAASLPGYHASYKECREHKKRITSEGRNLVKLDVYLCKSDEVLKAGGRLRRADLPMDQVNPVILPRCSETTNKIIRHYHELSAHAGRYSVVHLLRYQGWWITGIRSAVDFVIRNCVTCKRLRGRPVQQKMADLPSDRLEVSPPFTYCCVDFFGPFYVKEKRSVLKRWACLFSCLLLRAVHIEVCPDMTSDSFIRAYRRFVDRRGPVRSIRCDRGSNIMGSRGELDLACSRLDDEKIRRHMIQDDCDWVSFVPNPPKASHMGGVWERMIGSVRRCLEGLMAKYGHQLTDDSLKTVMTAAESMVNNRPLTYVDLSSPNDPQSITPAMLLTMKYKRVLAPYTEEDATEEDKYAKEQWKRVQLVSMRFWEKWKVDYLSTLTERHKWQKTHPNLQVDDVVLLVDQNLSRSAWPLARVVSVKVSDDGLVRSIMVRTKDGVYCRPIHKVVLLYRKPSKDN